MKDKITLSHGSGGNIMQDLIKDIAEDLPDETEGKVSLQDFDDGATVSRNGEEVVVTTDSHIVNPPFFPGGDIGRLSVSGTVNDLAVMGAEPEALTFSLILEEGFPREKLEKIVESVKNACEEAGVSILTGDTKVMPEGEIDGVAINTAGIGFCSSPVRDSGLEPGDKILVNGGVGEHGITMMDARDEYDFSSDLESDVQPLNDLISRLLETGGVKAMKDATRGGLAEAVNEMAEKSDVQVMLREDEIPMKDAVIGAGELLGIDPLELANEGKIVVGASPDKAEALLETMKKEGFKSAAIIGEVREGGKVYLETEIGGSKLLPAPEGNSLPRIC